MKRVVMKRLKLFLLIPSLGMGGAENITVNIARFIDREKYKVKIIVLSGENSSTDKYRSMLEENRIEIIFLNKKSGFDSAILKKLYVLFRQERPDIIHTHLYACVYSLIPAFLCGIKKKFHTVHNMADKELPQIHQKVMKVAYKFGGVVPIAINESVQKSIMSCYSLAEGKVPIVKNGVDISKFYRIEKKNYDVIQLINVGRFFEQKNHALLIACFEILVREFPNLNLTLIGEGELKNEIQEKVQEKGLKKNVHFTGNVSNVEDYLANADIYVMSSDYEGLPLSVIEGMAAGLAIVSTRAGGVVDLVQNGKNGFLTNVGDKDQLVHAVSVLLKDKTLLKQMQEASIKLASEYSVENMVKEYQKLYED